MLFLSIYIIIVLLITLSYISYHIYINVNFLQNSVDLWYIWIK